MARTLFEGGRLPRSWNGSLAVSRPVGRDTLEGKEGALRIRVVAPDLSGMLGSTASSRPASRSRPAASSKENVMFGGRNKDSVGGGARWPE
jgi:hypothetical protein